MQPDQLRLASRSISAKARVYGHPSAQWGISAESVSAFFELADVIVDLQAFARNELDAHENAIRQLDLTPETAAKAKIAIDLVTEGVLVSERVERTFESSAAVSDSAVERDVKVAVEGDRTLLVANLALAVARDLPKSIDQTTSQSEAADRSVDLPPRPSNSNRNDSPTSRSGGHSRSIWRVFLGGLWQTHCRAHQRERAEQNR